MIKKTGNPRFVYDAYRRLIMMYSDVVMEKAAGLEPEEGKGIRVQLDRMLHDLKNRKGYATDADISESTSRRLRRLSRAGQRGHRRNFPDDALNRCGALSDLCWHRGTASARFIPRIEKF
jgi:pyruvate,orthophosphate dikinase